MLRERACVLELLPRQIREVRQRPGERPSLARLHHTQMGAGRDAKTRQLIGGNAPVRGDDQIVARRLARCTHTVDFTAQRQRRSYRPKSTALCIVAVDIQLAPLVVGGLR